MNAASTDFDYLGPAHPSNTAGDTCTHQWDNWRKIRTGEKFRICYQCGIRWYLERRI